MAPANKHQLNWFLLVLTIVWVYFHPLTAMYYTPIISEIYESWELTIPLCEAKMIIIWMVWLIGICMEGWSKWSPTRFDKALTRGRVCGEGAIDSVCPRQWLEGVGGGKDGCRSGSLGGSWLPIQPDRQAWKKCAFPHNRPIRTSRLHHRRGRSGRIGRPREWE